MKRKVGIRGNEVAIIPARKIILQFYDMLYGHTCPRCGTTHSILVWENRPNELILTSPRTTKTICPVCGSMIEGCWYKVDEVVSKISSN